jgi:hypothetical protein
MRKLVIGTRLAELYPLMVPKAESCNAFLGRDDLPNSERRLTLSDALASATRLCDVLDCQAL